jgi:ADP-ribose pyrophosphatase YjhB (NUDIX family)
MKSKRAGALIIKDKRILLLSNDELDVYWTPGGRLDEGEDFVQALYRELNEEINIVPKSIKEFRDTSHGYTPTAKYFLVEIDDEPKLNTKEVTKMGWFSKEEISSGKVKASPNFTDYIFPELIKEKLL